MIKNIPSLRERNIYVVPNYIGFDSLDGYMQDQIVHPSNHGHEQIANQVYARLVELLNKSDYVADIKSNRERTTTK